MRYSIIIVCMISLLAAGCLYSPFGGGGNQTNQTPILPPIGNNATVTGTGTQNNSLPIPPEPLPPVTGGQQPPANPAPQEECSTLSPDCSSCLNKAGCGWCKSSNSCFSGTASGPSVSTCPASDWVTNSDNCAAPAGGSHCSEITNCATCLTGSGCKWCIQGSVCSDATSEGSCTGGWLNQSYQCNYASR